jgi:hypothetical protein
MNGDENSLLHTLKPTNAAMTVAVLVTGSVAFWCGVLFANIFPGFKEEPAKLLIDTAVAVGTIGAVVVALTVGRQQVNAALRAVRDAHSLEVQSRKEGIVAVGEAANAFANMIDELLSGPELNHPTCCANLRTVYDKSIVDGINFALKAAPAHEISTRDGVLALVSLRQRFDSLWQLVDLYLEHPEKDPEVRKELLNYPGSDGALDRVAYIKSVRNVRAVNVRNQIQGIARAYEALKGSLDADENAAAS